MTEDEIMNEIYDQIECTFSLQCDKCGEHFLVQKADKEDAVNHFFAEGFTFKKFKAGEVAGQIICVKCR